MPATCLGGSRRVFLVVPAVCFQESPQHVSRSLCSVFLGMRNKFRGNHVRFLVRRWHVSELYATGFCFSGRFGSLKRGLVTSRGNKIAKEVSAVGSETFNKRKCVKEGEREVGDLGIRPITNSLVGRRMPEERNRMQFGMVTRKVLGVGSAEYRKPERVEDLFCGRVDEYLQPTACPEFSRI